MVVPVGDGALIGGVGCAIKAYAPGTRVIGVCPEAAPSMAASWRRGVAVRAPAQTIASGLATVDPIPDSVHRMRAFVDEIVLVNEAGLIEAMRLAADTLGALLEPSGAASLAALLEHDMPGDLIAVVLTGSMIRVEHLALIVDATAHGRTPSVESSSNETYP